MKPYKMIAAAALAFATLGAWAQDPAANYPSRPVHIIVPFPAGGAADALPRAVGVHLSAKWGQPVVIENRSGASGSIGAELAFRADPDGYTLLATPPSPLVINPSLYKKLPYDPTRFVPVTVIGAIPSVLLVNPDKVPAKTLKEFIELVRTHPGQYNYASQGTTTVSFLTTELFLSLAGGLKITQIPYKGTAPGLAALLAGEVGIMFDNLGVTLPHIRAGKLRALAVAGAHRAAALPDVPAMNEFYPGFLSIAWFGIVAPPKTPQAIAEKIAIDVAEAIRQPDVQKRLARMSADPSGMSPAEMAKLMKEDAARWKAAIKAAGVSPQ